MKHIYKMSLTIKRKRRISNAEYGSKLELSLPGVSGNVVLMDVGQLREAFKVYTSTELNSTNVNYFSDGRLYMYLIVFCISNVSLANPPITFSDTVSFSQFSLIVAHLYLHHLME